MANVNDLVKARKKVALFEAVDLVGALNRAGAGLPENVKKVDNGPQR